MGRSYRIGITIGLRTPDESLWLNGVKQNAIFLARMLKASARGHRVKLLNTTDVELPSLRPWPFVGVNVEPFDAGCHELDVLIELGGQIDERQTETLKRQGTKIVSYCCGPEYVQIMEAILFDRSMGGHVFVNRRYDALWIIPQVETTSLGYFEVFRRIRATVAPFVWDPICIETSLAQHPDGGAYRPRGAAKRLSIIEPNIDVVKFCLYPILIAEQAYREAPDAIGFVHVANAKGFAERSGEFRSLMHQLDLTANGKISFIGRVEAPRFLADYTDCVVSHQWGLPLNYFYLECCWLGYPLVHNAEIVSDLGYYYDGNDLAAGAERLRQAMRWHDASWSAYAARQKRLIGRYLSSNPELIDRYDVMLSQLID